MVQDSFKLMSDNNAVLWMLKLLLPALKYLMSLMFKADFLETAFLRMPSDLHVSFPQ